MGREGGALDCRHSPTPTLGPHCRGRHGPGTADQSGFTQSGTRTAPFRGCDSRPGASGNRRESKFPPPCGSAGLREGVGGGGGMESFAAEYPAASQPVACGLPDHPLEPLRPLKPGPPPQPDIPVDRSGWAWPPSTAAGGCTSLPMLANDPHVPLLLQCHLPEQLLHTSTAP